MVRFRKYFLWFILEVLCAYTINFVINFFLAHEEEFVGARNIVEELVHGQGAAALVILVVVRLVGGP